MEGKGTTATDVSAGMTASLTQISVTIASVPSDPIRSFVKSYPAEDFLSSDCMILVLEITLAVDES